jgi:hypothetical protein
MRVAFLFSVMVLGTLTFAGSAAAGTKFAAYEGRASITDGSGGTKVTKDGVDFWTTGDPPRRYQVLGILTDTRGSGLFSGDAMGSAGLAKKIRDLGGDAVLMAGRNSHVNGAMVSGGNVLVARRTTTELVVVKYLDAAAAQRP